MTQKQENALKILYRLKSEEHIDFEEYFTLIESIIGENKTEYYPVTIPEQPYTPYNPYNPYPWLTPIYSKDSTGKPIQDNFYTTCDHTTFINDYIYTGFYDNTRED